MRPPCSSAAVRMTRTICTSLGPFALLPGGGYQFCPHQQVHETFMRLSVGFGLPRPPFIPLLVCLMLRGLPFTARVQEGHVCSGPLELFGTPSSLRGRNTLLLRAGEQDMDVCFLREPVWGWLARKATREKTFFGGTQFQHTLTLNNWLAWLQVCPVPFPGVVPSCAKPGGKRMPW